MRTLRTLDGRINWYFVCNWIFVGCLFAAAALLAIVTILQITR
jgi:hypothetical protein